MSDILDDGRPADWSRIEAVIERVPDDAERILDIGCVRHTAARRARGNLHARLHEEYSGAEIVGIDIDSEGIDAMDGPEYDLRVMDAESLDFAEPFDAIVAGELIEHLANPGQFLDGAREHLRHDGVLVLTTPNPWALVRLRNVLRGRDINPGHTCWMDARTLRQLLARYGFDVVIEPVPPPTAGITRVLYRLGAETLGATQLLVAARPEPAGARPRFESAGVPEASRGAPST